MKSGIVNLSAVIMFLLMTIMLSNVSSSTFTNITELGDEEDHKVPEFVREEEEEIGFGLIRGTGRMLATSQKKITCNKYPKVCRVAGSPGRDCCKKKCVNVDKDRSNCGNCGKKCKYSEVCCKGKCVNVLKNKKNCGGCGKKCNKGDTCRYGMCSYA